MHKVGYTHQFKHKEFVSSKYLWQEIQAFHYNKSLKWFMGKALDKQERGTWIFKAQIKETALASVAIPLRLVVLLCHITLKTAVPVIEYNFSSTLSKLWCLSSEERSA